MGLAIPAGGNLVAMSTWLFLSLDIDPLSFGWFYPFAIALTAYLMVSHVHYPDFKGGGEKIYMVSKIFGLVVFVGILYLGSAAILPAVFTAVFTTYALFGIVNHTIAVMARAKEG